MAEHTLPARPPNLHWRWDNALPPALTIDPVDTVVFETTDATGGQLTPDATLADLLTVDRDRLHTITGPVAIRGASPGDTLVVHILEIVPREWGFNWNRPGAGLLADDFPAPSMRAFRWRNADGAIHFGPGIRLPLRPFMGIYGVAPAVPGAHRTREPGVFGGNLDCRHLGPGATLYLPVQVPGALFSTGDGHAVQGDGEVNVTAVETGMQRVRLRFELRAGERLPRPQAETPTHYLTFGLDEDLDVAAQQALRDMIAYLGRAHGLPPAEAYRLCSLIVDLHVTQAVNGVRGVHAMLPKGIFTAQRIVDGR